MIMTVNMRWAAVMAAVAAVLVVLCAAPAEAADPATVLFNAVDEDNSGSWSEEELTELMEKLGLAKAGAHDDHDHDNAHAVRVSQAAASSPLEAHTRALALDECHSVDELIEEYDTNNDTLIAPAEASQMYPALLALQQAGLCATAATDSHASCSKPGKTKAWFGALGATLLVSLMGVLGIVIFPIVQKRWVLSALLGFAVGTLVGDAVLHLLPHALNVGDSDDGHAHANHPADSGKKYLGIVGTTAASVFFFFVVEKIIHSMGGHQHSHGEPGQGEHSHSHDGKVLSDSESGEVMASAALVTSSGSSDSVSSGSGSSQQEYMYEYSESAELQEEASYSSYSASAMDAKLQTRGTIFHTHFCYSVKPYAWLNLIGDGLHNIIDGLVLGVTFSSSTSAGIATMIAIIFHELPQELGDFGVLFKAGFSRIAALLFNLATAATAFVGCLIGLAIGQDYASANPYLLAFAAGSFLFIALSDLVPQLMHTSSIRLTLIEIAGILLGFVVMLIIALTEDEDECSGL
ncbi:zinc transporter ZIP12 [Thecamonas trahens ATCC 50062]|uniref:Zinc transporter ZIP12 n=1 Tax=Thecamonas trahens ATCC 50062 TaxID=461836 RepID=A0A0L0DD71_THETB|nr:zinc transporter ZIP12 [Thecamonas trahens ATCC 50062]KNC50051.1 zinc transporter ZIP12 [Thecamonas trahens ATCC 50062]|eukprot:XP_013757217.1 zinc transporter ZIP12 [Thecamonas trahens ATCC 50062]